MWWRLTHSSSSSYLKRYQIFLLQPRRTQTFQSEVGVRWPFRKMGNVRWPLQVRGLSKYPLSRRAKSESHKAKREYNTLFFKEGTLEAPWRNESFEASLSQDEILRSMRKD